MDKQIISYVQSGLFAPARLSKVVMECFDLSFENLMKIKCELRAWTHYEDLLKEKVESASFSPEDRQQFIREACFNLANHQGAILILPCCSMVDHLFREEIQKLAVQFELDLWVWSNETLKHL